MPTAQAAVHEALFCLRRQVFLVLFLVVVFTAVGRLLKPAVAYKDQTFPLVALPENTGNIR